MKLDCNKRFFPILVGNFEQTPQYGTDVETLGIVHVNCMAEGKRGLGTVLNKNSRSPTLLVMMKVGGKKKMGQFATEIQKERNKVTVSVF